MRELSATMTRTALSACAGLVCTLTTACLPQNVYRGMFIAVRRIEVPTGPAPDATLSHRRSPSASEHAVAERLTVAVLASSWGARPDGGKFWATFRRESNLCGGQKQKSATQRRPVDLACESTACLLRVQVPRSKASRSCCKYLQPSAIVYRHGR
jgi:hypothetical protein